MMRYVALDIETTGLNPDRCQILEIGAVVETDWTTPVELLPRLHLLVEHEMIAGEAAALAMHPELIRQFTLPKDSRWAETVREAEVCHRLRSFCIAAGAVPSDRKSPVLAGKNLATFDLRFIRRLPNSDAFRYCHRIIDPGLMWFDPAADSEPPSNTECAARAGVVNAKPHCPVHDAMSVIAIVRAARGRMYGSTV